MGAIEPPGETPGKAAKLKDEPFLDRLGLPGDGFLFVPEGEKMTIKINKEIASTIRNARVQKGIKLDALQRETKLSLGLLSMSERGKCNLSDKSLQLIANALGLNFKSLCRGGAV